MFKKFPRTFHFSFSEGVCSDDKIVKSDLLLKGHEIIVTEKMDGENTTMYRDHIHARSIDSKHHSSRDWVKRFHSSIAHLIPDGYRVCGENLFAKHSIGYDNLRSYFYGFSVWDDIGALSWEDTLMWFEEFNVTPVREIYRGEFSLDVIKEIINDLDTKIQEGIVVRTTDFIPYDCYDKLVVKWVRKNHVTSNQHWMHQAITINKLTEE